MARKRVTTSSARSAPTQAAVLVPQRVAANSGTTCLRCLFCCTATLVAVVLIVWALPSPIDPVAFSYSSKGMPAFTGPLAINDHLQKASRVFENEIAGPEAFAVDKEGHVYSGLADGRIIRFDQRCATYTTVARMGKPPYDKCGSTEAEQDCGRGLGMHFDPHNPDELYTVDSSRGLTKVNVRTGEVRLLAPSHDKTGKFPYMNFVNDLIVLSNGSVFFTDSSKKFGRVHNRMEVLECRANGQLLHYNPTDNSVGVIAEDLFFPNGICISHDGQSLLVVELTRARILRYHLTGSNAGTFDVFAENLPGLPDNISPSSSGGYWLGVAVTRQSRLLDFLTGFPFVRTMVVKFHLISIIEVFLPKHGLVLEVDSGGRVVRSLHDQGGKVTFTTSEVLEIGNTLFVGSYFAPYLVKLNL